MVGRQCHSCGREISRDELIYEIKIEIYAKAEPIELTDEDLDRDFRGEIERLIETMEGMDTEDLSDQVYECYRFDLCAACREDLHVKLKLKTKEAR